MYAHTTPSVGTAFWSYQSSTDVNVLTASGNAPDVPWTKSMGEGYVATEAGQQQQVGEEESWGKLASRARENWMNENPY